MTVPSTTRRAGPFTGTGALVAYPFTFKVFAKQDLAVTIADANGLETDLVLDSTFTVTLNVDQEATPGGTVNYAVGGVATALPSGYTLVVTGDGLEFEQTADLPQGGNFSPVVIENALDRVVMLQQRLWDGVRRSMRLPDTASDSVSTVLPTPTANNFIGWDSNGTALRNVDPNTLATVVAFAAWQSQAFSGDGVTTQFTLSSDPGNVNNLDVVVGAVPQRNNVDFTLSGVVLTFDVAPANGLSIFCRWGQALPEGTSTLQTRLASGASAADNAGMIALDQGFSPNYAAGTIGAFFSGAWIDITSRINGTSGAVADGTDQTAKINAATYAASLYGADVYVPPGTFICNEILHYPNQTIFGAGEQSVLKQKASAPTNSALIRNIDVGTNIDGSDTVGQSRNHLYRLCLDGNKANQSNSGLNLVKWRQVKFSNITHCLLRNSKGYAINGCNGIDHCIIAFNQFTNNVGTDIEIRWVSNRNHIHTNTIIGANLPVSDGGEAGAVTGDAIVISSTNMSGGVDFNCAEFLIHHNVVKGKVNGISITGLFDSQIERNILGTQTGYAVVMGKGATWFCQGIGLVGNIINHEASSSFKGIYLLGQRIDCSHNHIYSSFADSIFVSTDTNNQQIDICDNIIKFTAPQDVGSGIVVRNLNRGKIAGNNIRWARDGISLTTPPTSNTITEIDIDNNRISDGSRRGIVIEDGGSTRVVKSISASGNKIYLCGAQAANTHDAIFIEQGGGTVSHIWLDNNTAFDTDAKQRYGVNISGTTTNIVVEPTNRFVGMQSGGVNGYFTAAPTTGTWEKGQDITFFAAAAGGVPGARCVSSGGPGTWKNHAAIAA